MAAAQKNGWRHSGVSVCFTFGVIAGFEALAAEREGNQDEDDLAVSADPLEAVLLRA
jgi:hypothetical protein